MKIAIIGSAGRHADAPRVTPQLYGKMITAAANLIAPIDDKIILVSGGASFADHVAVDLFLTSTDIDLELHLPSPWNHELKEYSHDGAGKTSNFYHRSFCEKIGRELNNSLYDLHKIISAQINARAFFYNGFKIRNLEVGKVDMVIAFTFNDSDEPKPGGTKHTWDNSTASKKNHINLGGL